MERYCTSDVLCQFIKCLSCLSNDSSVFQIRFWDLPHRLCTRSFQAHDGFVRGLTFTPDSQNLLSIGDDKTIKLWGLEEGQEEPINTVLSKVLCQLIYHRYFIQIFSCMPSFVNSDYNFLTEPPIWRE